jgi:hypothetical protein
MVVISFSAAAEAAAKSEPSVESYRRILVMA